MRSSNFATRRERQGPVKASEIAAALRAMADKIEQGGRQVAPTVSVAEARYKASPPAPAGGNGTVVGVVAFWDVKTRDNGKTMASLKLKDDRRFVCFDGDVIARIDPLMRGDNVVVSIKPWTKKDGSIEQLITNVAKGGATQGISDDEIPF
jgi:hypothetical protein